jgi:HPt (histidine-containing phosphotransfer) domain-containing protein
MGIMESKSDKPIDIADPFARQLMARYLERRESDIDLLRHALDSADFEKIRITGHNLFGSGAAYGLEEISRLGENIEIAAEGRDTAAIERLIGDFERFLKDLKLR